VETHGTGRGFCGQFLLGPSQFIASYNDITAPLAAKVEDILRDGDIAVGKVAIGASVKVCAVGSRDPLPYGTEGELHFASRMMCKGYLDIGLTDDFYEDEAGRLWFATGDAAMINEEGLIFIVGRIKDMIIRGGVNISPAAIEFVLQKEPATKIFNIQVVGALDRIAGEVPIAVSEKPLSLEETDIVINTVLEHMGPVFVPEEVLSLAALSLTDFPKTTTTKHQKGKLRDSVRDYIKARDFTTTSLTRSYEHDELTEKIQNVWKRTIGHTVDLDTAITEFADSITIMRVRDRINRDIGSTLSLADMLSTKTVKEQITMLRNVQENGHVVQKSIKQMNGTDRVGETGKPVGPSHTDIVHLKNAPQLFDSTRAFIESQIAEHGLAWNDVGAVFPASDFVQVLSQADILNESWSWKFCFLANTGVNKQQLRQAVQTFLTNNLALASFLFWNRAAFGSDISLHVIPSASETLFNTIISDLGSVTSKDDFGKLGLNPYEYEHATLPGPFIKSFLVDVEDVQRSGCVMVMHHVPMDATYMHNIFEDLDCALGFSKPLEAHIPWKTWADSYFSLRNSHEAQVAVSWHVNRLNNLLESKVGVFPPLPKVPIRIQATDDNGYHTTFEATGMTNLRRKHPHLAPPTVMKAAWSLMNLNRTGHTHAIFTNLQADRRKFPFIPPALEALVPPDAFSATNVAGLTLQDVINIIPLISNESLIDFMGRIHLDQEDLNKYAAAPLKQIMTEMGGINSEILLDILRSQIFNWTTGLGALESGNPYENYEPVSGAIRPSLRLVINVDVAGEKDETVYMQIKSPLYDNDGLKAIADEVEDFTRWLVNEENWESKIGNFKDALRSNKKQVHGSDSASTDQDGSIERNTKAQFL